MVEIKLIKGQYLKVYNLNNSYNIFYYVDGIKFRLIDLGDIKFIDVYINNDLLTTTSIITKFEILCLESY